MTVNVPGGPLFIDWSEQTGRVTMTGPAEWEFSGMLDPQSGAWKPDVQDGAQERENVS